MLKYARNIGKTIAAPLLFAILLTGCVTTGGVKPEPQIVVKQEYIIKIPPAELLTVPPAVPDVDVDNAKQSDIARWINSIVERMDTLENQVIGIGKFFAEEQKKLEPKRVTK